MTGGKAEYPHMGLGVTAGACVVVFVAAAFLLRARMRRLHVIYQTRLHTLLAAELALLHEGASPDTASLERQIAEAIKNANVMRKHAPLFRLLWPDEFDRALYTGERLIAQASRMSALTERAEIAR